LPRGAAAKSKTLREPRDGSSHFTGHIPGRGVAQPGEAKGFYVSPVMAVAILRGQSIMNAITMYYVYVLENDAHGWYIGFTENLKRRLSDHQAKVGGKTTQSGNGWKLIYFEGYRAKIDAIGREKFLKSGSGRAYLKKQLRNYLLQK
jgi:putative endonuclease